ncbi:conserved hypothetical protein [Trichinella spiralis]|uniref:hypothetical protein n=1 Tax=Trichinella spiralis TaxID=6334 RepID=UPI0001EFEAE4|nr:conserved hypothetical protein [Trichinella spiralis]
MIWFDGKKFYQAVVNSISEDKPSREELEALQCILNENVDKIVQLMPLPRRNSDDRALVISAHAEGGERENFKQYGFTRGLCAVYLFFKRSWYFAEALRAIALNIKGRRWACDRPLAMTVLLSEYMSQLLSNGLLYNTLQRRDRLADEEALFMESLKHKPFHYMRQKLLSDDIYRDEFLQRRFHVYLIQLLVFFRTKCENVSLNQTAEAKDSLHFIQLVLLIKEFYQYDPFNLHLGNAYFDFTPTPSLSPDPEAMEQYSISLEQAIAASGLTEVPISTEIDPVELQCLKRCLYLIAALAERNPLPRSMIFNSKDWNCSTTLINLLGYPLPVDFKQAILAVLDALTKTEEFALSICSAAVESGLFHSTNGRHSAFLIELLKEDSERGPFLLSTALLNLVRTSVHHRTFIEETDPTYTIYLSLLLHRIIPKIMTITVKCTSEKVELFNLLIETLYDWMINLGNSLENIRSRALATEVLTSVLTGGRLYNWLLTNVLKFCYDIAVKHRQILHDRYEAQSIPVEMETVNMLMISGQYKLCENRFICMLIKFFSYCPFHPMLSLLAIKILREINFAEFPQWSVLAALASEVCCDVFCVLVDSNGANLQQDVSKVIYSFVACLDIDGVDINQVDSNAKLESLFKKTDAQIRGMVALEMLEFLNDNITFVSRMDPRSGINTTTIPNSSSIALFVAGFDIRNPETTVLEEMGKFVVWSNMFSLSPFAIVAGVQGTRKTVLHAALEILASGLDKNKDAVSFGALLEPAYRFCYLLCEVRSSREVFLRFVRSTQDFVFRHFSHFVQFFASEEGDTKWDSVLFSLISNRPLLEEPLQWTPPELENIEINRVLPLLNTCTSEIPTGYRLCYLPTLMATLEREDFVNLTGKVSKAVFILGAWFRRLKAVQRWTTAEFMDKAIAGSLTEEEVTELPTDMIEYSNNETEPHLLRSLTYIMHLLIRRIECNEVRQSEESQLYYYSMFLLFLHMLPFLSVKNTFPMSHFIPDKVLGRTKLAQSEELSIPDQQQYAHSWEIRMASVEAMNLCETSILGGYVRHHVDALLDEDNAPLNGVLSNAKANGSPHALHIARLAFLTTIAADKNGALHLIQLNTFEKLAEMNSYELLFPNLDSDEVDGSGITLGRRCRTVMMAVLQMCSTVLDHFEDGHLVCQQAMLTFLSKHVTMFSWLIDAHNGVVLASLEDLRLLKRLVAVLTPCTRLELLQAAVDNERTAVAKSLSQLLGRLLSCFTEYMTNFENNHDCVDYDTLIVFEDFELHILQIAEELIDFCILHIGVGGYKRKKYSPFLCLPAIPQDCEEIALSVLLIQMLQQCVVYWKTHCAKTPLEKGIDLCFSFSFHFSLALFEKTLFALRCHILSTIYRYADSAQPVNVERGGVVDNGDAASNAEAELLALKSFRSTLRNDLTAALFDNLVQLADVCERKERQILSILFHSFILTFVLILVFRGQRAVDTGLGYFLKAEIFSRRHTRNSGPCVEFSLT